MSPRNQYIGIAFGKLTPIAAAEPKIRKRGTKMLRFVCRCDCGRLATVYAQDLRGGNTKSCGCSKNAFIRDRNKTHGLSISSVVRDQKATAEYNAWSGMIQRCEYAKHISFKYYGARGIKVCERWRGSFEDFLADMGPKPTPQHSIDRIDGDGHYDPINCRWATAKEQFANLEPSAEFKAHMRRKAKPTHLSLNPRFR